MDSTAFFHDFGPAADNGVTGIVTLLAAAKALGDYKRHLLVMNVFCSPLFDCSFVPSFRRSFGRSFVLSFGRSFVR